MISSFQKHRLKLVGIFYIALGLVIWLRFYRYQINPDGVSALQSAIRLTQFDIIGGVNGYWGPLYSVLIALFILIGFKSFIAAKFLGFLTGGFFLWQLQKVFKVLGIKEHISFLSLILAVPCSVYFFTSLITADFLFLNFIILFLTHLLFPRSNFSFSWVIVSALFTALVYYTKVYGLFFCFSVFCFWQFIIWKNGWLKLSRVIINFFTYTLLLFLLIGPWVFFLNHKYQQGPVLSTTIKYNKSLTGPNSKGHALHWAGFIKPKDEKAISAWDDPSYLPQNPEWNALKSEEDVKYQKIIIEKNLEKEVEFFKDFNANFFWIFLILIFSVLRGTKVSAIFLFLFILYPLGYTWVHIEDIRYLWPLWVLLYIFSTKIVSDRKSFLVQIFCFYFFMIPFAKPLILKTYQERQPNKYLHDISREIERDYNFKNVKFASDNNWADSLLLGFHTQSQYYGEIGGELRSLKDLSWLEKELKEKNITHYVSWWEDKYDFVAQNALNRGFKEILNGKYGRLRIYVRE